MEKINTKFTDFLNDNFNQWFSKSKLTDNKGNPIIFYHGSNSKVKFNKFNDDTPIWFTKNKDYAKAFISKTGNLYKAFLSLENPLYIGHIDGIANNSKIQKLSELTTIDIHILEDILQKSKGMHIFDITNNNQFKSIVEEMGYDGLIAKEGGDTDTIAVFNPNNINIISVDKLSDIVNENKTYDEILALKDWYASETKKLDNIKDFKKWKLKTKLLQNQYRNKMDKLTKEKNPFAMRGDKGASFIYHYTDADSLINIIKDNILLGGGDYYGGISFTTHPNLYKRGFVFWYPGKYSQGKYHKNIGVKIKFDFNMMKKDGLKFKAGTENMGTHPGEEELRLLQNELDNPIKYIKEVIIFSNKEKRYKELSKLLNDFQIKNKIV